MNESDAYVNVAEDPTQSSLKAVKRLVNRMAKDGVISKEMQQYLIPKHSKAGKLKGNPKIHKESAPYRAIVSGIGTPTEKLAEVAEYELEEFVIQTPSYLRDTTDFINKLADVKEDIPKDAILFCFDVCKLYPSIPREEGLEACKEGLERRSRPIIPTGYAMEMIKVVLDNNNFSLGDKHFLQKGGVAIWSRLGRNFACSFMRKWDEKLLEFETKPFFYKCYIDDGFGIWTAGLDSLLRFADFANNIHGDIKLELRWSKEEIVFLDTVVKIAGGQLYTDLHIKPTDKQLYIQQKSCHPTHTKNVTCVQPWTENKTNMREWGRLQKA